MVDVLAYVAKQPEPVSREVIASRFTGCNGWLTRVLATLVEHRYLRRPSHGMYAVGEQFKAPACASDLAGKRVLLFSRWRGVLHHGLMDGVRQELDQQDVALHSMAFESEQPLEDLFAQIDEIKCHGLVFFEPRPLTDSFVHELNECKLPVVQIGYINPIYWDVVDWSRSFAYRDLAKALVKAGCSILFYLEPPVALKHKHAFALQRASCTAVADEAGVPCRKIPVGDQDLALPTEASVLAQALSALPEKAMPGIVCGLPNQAVPLLLWLESRGIRSGCDVHVAAVVNDFDPYIEYCASKFVRTLIKSDRAIGAAAAEQVLLRMRGTCSAPSLRLIPCSWELSRGAVGMLALEMTVL